MLRCSLAPACCVRSGVFGSGILPYLVCTYAACVPPAALYAMYAVGQWLWGGLQGAENSPGMRHGWPVMLVS